MQQTFEIDPDGGASCHKLTHKCGVVFRMAPPGVDQRPECAAMLRSVAHRGKDTRIGYFINEGGDFHRVGGKVIAQEEEPFSRRVLMELPSDLGRWFIGHTRYRTNGLSLDCNEQPMRRVVGALGKEEQLFWAHNGELKNHVSLAAYYKDSSFAPSGTSDSALIGSIFAEAVHDYPEASTIDTVKHVLEMLEESYALVIWFRGEVFACRGPSGIRPLAISRNSKTGVVAIASETRAVLQNTVPGGHARELMPGTITQVFPDGRVASHSFAPLQTTSGCAFEQIYFSRPDSVSRGILLQDARAVIGKLIGERFSSKLPTDNSYIVPILGSGEPYAEGLSTVYEKPIVNLLQPMTADRAFIDGGDRTVAAKSKHKVCKEKLSELLNSHNNDLSNLSLVLIDDSIVRSDTIRAVLAEISETLTRYGFNMANVTVIAAAPPIVGPCHLGINIAAEGELIAPGKSLEQIAAEIGCGQLIYGSLSDLMAAFKTTSSDMCTGCMTREFPDELKPPLNPKFQYPIVIDPYLTPPKLSSGGYDFQVELSILVR